MGGRIAPDLRLAVGAFRPVPGKGPRDECGVFGVYGHPEAARLTYYGLYALQHRGEESAGIAVSTGDRLLSHRGMGLVTDVFRDEDLARLQGPHAVGHVRYSTTGSSTLANAQPIVVETRRGSLAVAHNGNFVTARAVRARLEDEGAIFSTTSDTEVLAHLIARHRGGGGIEEALVVALQELTGGYALVLLTEDRLLAVRDPHGIRPLSLGRLGDAWLVASETCAFDTVGAEFVRDVAPGELVMIRDGHLRSRQALPAASPSRICVFEYVYFARPDSNLQGRNVHAARKEMGRELWREAPVEADLVIGVPDSSISAATGFAEASGIPYEMGLIKNRYIGRTFIQPQQGLRAQGVKIKHNPLRLILEGKRVVLVDDSIVRGTTIRHLISLLREAGAREVHLRIASPPYRFGCHYGIDTADIRDLVARGRDVEAIREAVGADSLHYLSVEGLARAVGTAGYPGSGFCMACFTGEYPVPVDEKAGKFALEARRHAP
ncbi:amidophosphoribosyltransferase [Caldinitratiruptor microaerophilus]|uniref:Amidophosphoribosyltransferase n=1 Tax=Caldinitratiruptor microaerophilus TaxID=671077 RepID=A0AA35CLE6_9FIRM|nr:amidophosphoribosyltransferase [Caldinitratiruptor microaerophilus]BDG61282.1 amidophosphoribosyltransferase [Caldinitratiruptor microaerophilus]